MSQEPSDDLIEETILEQLLALETNVKPNKLRKIVCKKISSTNWTQFQRILEKLIDTGKIKLEGREQAEQVLILSTEKKKSNSHKTHEQSKRSLNDLMEVPIAIVSNLLRKGKKKQKNIETNTKTRLTFDKDAILAVRKNDFVSKKKTNIHITSEILDDDEEIAKKHVKAAKVMIRKMVQAFQENPDNFVRKAGGTFAEQDEAKKRKAEVIQKLQQKKNNVKAENDDIVPKQSGKKKRKFY